MWIDYNCNPSGKRVGDCSVRAISKAVGQDWTDTYIGLCAEGLAFKDMPSSNYVWGMYLKKFGFEEHMISSVCPNCVTVSEFAKDHPKGRYILACQNHVVAVIDGDHHSSEGLLLYRSGRKYLNRNGRNNARTCYQRAKCQSYS